MRKDIIAGYVFPNPPQSWSQEEKKFAQALRQLFDTLYSRMRKAETELEKLKNINEVTDDVSD